MLSKNTRNAEKNTHLHVIRLHHMINTHTRNAR